MVEIDSTWLSPNAWGSGANVEAKLLMMEHAFETLGCVVLGLPSSLSSLLGGGDDGVSAGIRRFELTGGRLFCADQRVDEI